MRARKVYTHEEFSKNIRNDVMLMSKFTRQQDKVHCKCKVCGHEWEAWPQSLLNGHGCVKCMARKYSEKYAKDEEVFKSQVLEVSGGFIEVIGEYKNNRTKVKCRCKKDGHIWESDPRNLLAGKGCPVCCNKAIVEGINDFATTHKEMLVYFKDKSVAKTVTYGTKKKVDLICPVCKTETRQSILSLTYYGFCCPKCSDGISYPNKFGREFLSQVKAENVIYEWKPDWLKPYSFDNYFEVNGVSYVLEMDGEYHYIDKGKRNQTMKNDVIKDELARKHNIEVIRIECMKSKMEHIRENILKSRLSELFDLSIVDWNKCDLAGNKNILHEVCEFYNKSGMRSPTHIGRIFGLHRRTIAQYIRVGKSVGLCGQ